MDRWLFRAFVVFAPFTTWFAFTGWLRLPLLCILMGTVAALPFLLRNFSQRANRIVKNQEDWLLLAMLPLMSVSFLMGTRSGRSFNHLLSFYFVFVVYLVLFKYYVFEKQFGVWKLLRLVTISVILCNLIIVVEWATVNYTSLIIRKWFLFSEKTTNMVYYDQLFFRSVAGVAEEPSLMAFNLNALAPLGFYYLQARVSTKAAWLFAGLHGLGLLFMASAGGIGFLVLGLVASRLLVFRPKRLLGISTILALVAVIAYVAYEGASVQTQYKTTAFIAKVGGKLTFNSASSGMRVHAWRLALTDWESAPFFGKGPGYGNEAYHGFGYQNAYLKILAETGVLPLLLFLVFLCFIGYRVLKLPNSVRPYFVIGYVASVGHLFIADAYYHVSFWILIVILQYIYLEAKPVSDIESCNQKLASENIK